MLLPSVKQSPGKATAEHPLQCTSPWEDREEGHQRWCYPYQDGTQTFQGTATASPSPWPENLRVPLL